jgi:3-oxoacyl-(acyl-carrier-protein) synthase
LKIVVLATGHSDLSRAVEFRTQPRFRKATSNMILGFDALAQVMSALPVNESVKDSLYQNSAFVLGSSYGEIEYTKDFLKALVVTGLARPLLFQSSLHNATLGFLSLELKMPGPSFTVSQRFFSGEKTLETAQELLKSGMVDTCFCVATDVMSEELMPSLDLYHQNGFVWKGGAGALLLATEEKARALGVQPLAVLGEISYSKTGGKVPTGNFYDSDGLGNFAHAIQSSLPEREIIQCKPDLTYSKISWT